MGRTVKPLRAKRFVYKAVLLGRAARVVALRVQVGVRKPFRQLAKVVVVPFVYVLRGSPIFDTQV